MSSGTPQVEIVVKSRTRKRRDKEKKEHQSLLFILLPLDLIGSLSGLQCMCRI